MNPLLALAHLPVILLLSGALILVLAGTRLHVRARYGIAWAVCIGLGGLLLFMKSQLPLDIVFSDWLVGLTLLGSLIYQVDSLNWTFAVLLFVLIFAVVVLWSTGRETSRSPRLLPGLFLFSAGAFSLLFSGNILTLMFSWVFLIAAAFILWSAAMEPDPPGCHLLITWSLGAFVLVWAVWNMGRGDGGRWSALPGSGSAVLAVFLVAWIATGAYPMHLWLPYRNQGTEDFLIVVHTLPVLMGLYLLARLSLLEAVLPWQDLWIGLGALALLIAAQLAWSQKNRGRALSYVGTTLSGAVILSAALLLPRSTGSLWVWTLSLPFSMLVLLSVPSRVATEPRDWRNQLSRGVTGLAGASLLGIPPTAGFIAWGRLHNARLMAESNLTMLLLFVILVVSGVLLSAAFFRIWSGTPDAPSTRDNWYPEIMGLLMLIPALGMGLAPGLVLGYLAGPGWGEWGSQVYASMTAGIWATIPLSIGIGYVLTLWPPAAAVAFEHPAWRTVVQVLCLDWVCIALREVVRRMSESLDRVTDMLQGEHYLLWVLLALLLFAWLYLFP